MSKCTICGKEKDYYKTRLLCPICSGSGKNKKLECKTCKGTRYVDKVLYGCKDCKS